MHEQMINQESSLIKRLDQWSNWLLVIVVFIPFAVSFGALADLAAANGVNYPYLYPLMIDLSLIIFNLIALRSSLYGERNLYAWGLVFTATGISVFLNVVHAPTTALGMFMAGLPPLFILAAFHLVVMRIEQSVRRSQAMHTLQDLQQQIAAMRDELSTLQKTMSAHKQSGGPSQIMPKRLPNQSRKKQPPKPGIHARHEQLVKLLGDGKQKMTQAELADALAVSISTIRRDLKQIQTNNQP